MKPFDLGIISWIGEQDFKRARDRELACVELDVNDRAEEFLAHVDEVEAYSRKYEMPVAAIGRWGSDRIDKNGPRGEELQLEYRLIEAAARLSCPVYITGCNYVDEISYYENVTYAIRYFEKLIAFGRDRGVKIAVYNCRWNNFVCTPTEFRLIHGYLKELWIKYDPSHCIYDGGDYMKEARDWGHRFAHVHLKGSVVIGGERYDDPPAGMDQTNWGAFLSVLYAKKYQGVLSIEPHSANWQGQLGEKGINATIKYFKNILL